MQTYPTRPGPMNTKHLLSGAVQDLSLGDMLTEQLDAQTEERKKKLLSASRVGGVAPMLSGSVLDLGLTA